MAHTRTVRRTPQELRDFSEHLLYELQLLFRIADRLRAFAARPGEAPWEVEMACIEAFAIHARGLEDFIWGDPKERFPDDAFASEYFAAGAWQELRERVQRSALDDVAARTGHEIAHLSHKRATESTDERAWPFDVIAGVIGRAIRLFLEHVPRDNVVADFEARLRSTWPEYLNQPVAVSFPPDGAPWSVATKMMSGPGQSTRFEDLLPRPQPSSHEQP
jgi:hypothetical protein